MSQDHTSAQPHDGRRHRVPEMRDLRFRILPVPNLQLHGHAPTRLTATNTTTTVHGPRNEPVTDNDRHLERVDTRRH